MQDHATHELHVEVAHVQDAPAGLAGQGEDLGQQGVEVPAVGHFLAPGGHARREVGVGQGLHGGFVGIDLRHGGLQGFEEPVVSGSEYLLGQITYHECSRLVGPGGGKILAWGLRAG
jgi:hypothetical protein